MRTIVSMSVKVTALLFLGVVLFSPCAGARGDAIDFESDLWVLKDAEIIEHMGRKCLIGAAYLRDVEFENGVIEVDIAVDGTRSYPGIDFRIQSEEDLERFYIRPHRGGLYPDALQYTPVFNGVAGWQLYNGEGFTAGADIPANQWIHFRMEVFGKQARVFIDGADSPALVINDLKHGLSRGSVGVFGPKNKTSCFSNFSYEIDNKLQFDPPQEVETPPGIITKWLLSPSFELSRIDLKSYPDEEMLEGTKWQEVRSEPSGLVDISRYVKRSGREPDCVLAKAVVDSGRDDVKQLLFGYSDAISIFLNGEILFLGNSAYRQRDPSFLGIVGLNDAVFLPLRKGENELLIMVAESFGGWGFMCQDGTAVFRHESVEKVWETADEFLTPESVVYDAARDVLFVSNYDAYNRSGSEEGQFISKVSVDGKIEDLRWVTGLHNPTGMAIFGDKLFVVERGGLVEIDIDSGRVLGRHPVTQPRFLNDAAVDRSGNVYVSDSGKNAVYRYSEGSFEEWLKGDQVGRPNGLHVHQDRLIVGNNSDGRLKVFDLADREAGTIVKLGPGVIDGIRTDKDGNYLVSHWEGRVYRITPSGRIEKLLDTSVPALNCADFEYVPKKNLIVIPTFFSDKVAAYRVK